MNGFAKINTIKPLIAHNEEPTRILNLEAMIIVVSVNARLLMNIDIVNPIPPNRPIPIRYRQFKPSEKKVNPDLISIHGKRNIPSNLPITRPPMIPAELDVDKLPAIC